MTVRIGTFDSKHDYEVNTVTQANALVLESGDSVVRPFQLKSGVKWNNLTLAFRVAVRGGPSSGNLSNCYFFAGFCSSVDTRYNQAGANCIGTEASANSTFTGVTSANTDPSGENYYWTFTQWAVSYTSGSRNAAGGSGGLLFPRHETVWTSSAVGYDLIGSPFMPRGVSIQTQNISTTGVLYSKWNTPELGVNSGIHYMAMQGGEFDQGNLMTSYSRNCDKYRLAIGYPTSATVNNSGAGVNTPAVDTYGDLTNINFFWQTSTSGVQLLIKDIAVAAAYEVDTPAAFTLNVGAASPSSSILTW